MRISYADHAREVVTQELELPADPRVPRIPTVLASCISRRARRVPGVSPINEVRRRSRIMRVLLSTQTVLVRDGFPISGRVAQAFDTKIVIPE